MELARWPLVPELPDLALLAHCRERAVADALVVQLIRQDSAVEAFFGYRLLHGIAWHLLVDDVSNLLDLSSLFVVI